MVHHPDPLAQSVEHLTFNQGVPRSSRGWITIIGTLEKGLNSPAFHAGIHGFESRTCHHRSRMLSLHPGFFCADFTYFYQFFINLGNTCSIFAAVL